MAKKISDLDPAAAAFLVDQDECDQSGTSRRVSNAQRIALYKDNLYDQTLDTTDAVTFATVNTGQGANELYPMDQSLTSSSSITCNTINTGQGNNNLFDMNQNVLTSSDVLFSSVSAQTKLYASTIAERFPASLITMEDGIKLPTSGGTASSLDYYEEFSDTFTFDFGGNVWTALQTITIKFVRVGKFVNMQFDNNLINTTQAAPGSDIDLWAGSLIPSRFRPFANLTQCGRNIINNTSTINESASIFIQTTGDITIRQNQTAPNWPANQPNTGMAAASFNWITA